MTKKILSLLLLAIIIIPAWSQVGGSWIQKAVFAGGGTGSTRESAIAFYGNNHGYIGLGNSGGSVNGTLWQYNPSTNVWTQKATILAGGARQGAVSFVINGVAYVGTGENSSFAKDKKFYAYDLTGNTWTAKADFGGTARTGAVAFSIGAKGYVGTGNDGARKKDFWEYDPTGNTWTQKADFGGTARENAVGFAVNGKGYIATGNDGARKKDVWQYDPLNNTWTQKGDFAGAARESATAFVLNNIVYLAIGDTGVGSKEIFEYDAETDKWIRRVDFAGDRRYAAVSFATDGLTAYLGTGFSDAGATGVNKNDFWEFANYAIANSPVLSPISYYTPTSLRIRWSHSSTSSFTNFEILRSTNGIDFTLIGTTANYTFEYTDTNLSKNQIYYYRVRAASTTGTSPASNIMSQTTQINPYLGLWTGVTDPNTEVGPKSVGALQAFTIGDVIYFPLKRTSSEATNEVWAYNTKTKAWTSVATGPAPRIGYSSFVIQGKGYITGGVTSTSTYLNDLWQYDPVANAWTQKASHPGPARTYAGALVIDNKAYIGGGTNATSLDDFWEYNPATNAWNQKATIPSKIYSPASFTQDGKGFLALGSTDKVYEYNSVNNQWTTRSSTLFPVSTLYAHGSKAHVINNRVFVITYFNARAVLWEYIVADNRWVELNSPVESATNSSATIAAAGDFLYFFFGNNSHYLSTFDPASSLRAPYNFSATIIDAAKVKLAWAISDASTTQFKIYRSSSQDGTYNLIVTLDSNTLEYFNTIDNPAATWYYKIQAINENGTSRLGDAVLATPQGAWKKLKNIPSTSANISTWVGSATDDKAYFFNIRSSNKMAWAYDPSNDTWTQKANFVGEARYGNITMSIDNNIYLGLGQQENGTQLYKDMWQYDPSSNQWTQKSDFAGSARTFACGVGYNGKGFVVMGDDGNTGTQFLKDVWQYNAQEDTWSAMPEFPATGTRSAVVYMYNNELVVMNGWIKNTSGYSSIRQLYSLNMSNNMWKKGTSPTMGGSESSFFLIGEKAYLIDNWRFDQIWSYNNSNGISKFEVGPPLPRITKLFSIGNKGYAMGDNYQLWMFEPDMYVAQPTNLTSKLQDGRIILQWQNNSTEPVTTVLEFLTTTYPYSLYTKIEEVGVGINAYDFTKYTQDNHYYIRAYAISAGGLHSPASNTTNVNVGPHWSKIGSAPITLRASPVIEALNNKIFFGLGLDSDGRAKKDFWMYEEATGVWTQKAPYGGDARSEATSFVLNNNVYVGLGRASAVFNDFWKYDLAANTWTLATTFPKTATYDPSVFEYQKNIYLIGGAVSPNQSSTELWRFDGNNWTQLTSFPGDPRAHPMAFVMNGKAYIGGGQKIVNGAYYSWVPEFYYYTIANDSWRKLKNLPSGITTSKPYAYLLNDFAYVFVPGSDGLESFTYSPAQDIWTPSNIPLYPFSSLNVYSVQSASGLGFTLVQKLDGYELWRFDPLTGGPKIINITNSQSKTAKIAWNKIVPRPDSLYVERSDAENGAFVKAAVIKSNDTIAFDKVPLANKKYFYRIRSFSGASYARYSNTKEVIIAPIPAGPTLTLTYDGSLNLQWNAISGVSKYVIERSINDAGFTSIDTVGTTSYSDVLTTAIGNMYTYRIYGIEQETALSNTVSVLITDVEKNVSSYFGVHPNPSKEKVTITVPETFKSYNLTLINNSGKTIIKRMIKNNDQIDMSAYPPGFYFVSLQGEDQVKVTILKLIKQ